MTTPVSGEKQAFFVQAEDGRKFKMVIRGDLHKLQVEKIKRYLKSYGVPEGQGLSYNGMYLTDDLVGEDFGLTMNATLKLVPPREGISPQGQKEPYSIKTPQKVTAEREMKKHCMTGDSLENTRAPPASYESSIGQPSRSRYGNSQNDNNDVDHEVRAKVVSLEAENERLNREIERLKSELEMKRQTAPPSDDMTFNAKANLLELSKDLGVHLAFDQNLTCAIGNDERNTILVTFDAATERLYLYSTVLTSIPENEGVRLKLLETLMDGAMLGRDMAGGGIGLSSQNNIIMMSTSFSLRSCDAFALRDITPAFLEALQRWRAVAVDICFS
eukprot:Tbor_TRINITY_DN3158_c0_g1::TRINITY_DN3158_c0_g1_i1::g.14726::m.14726